MENRLYLFRKDSSKSKFDIDIDATRTLSRVHRESRVNAVFMESFEGFRLFRRYCDTNETATIERVETNFIEPSDIFILMHQYVQGSPEKNQLFYLGIDKNIGVLRELSKKSGFGIINL